MGMFDNSGSLEKKRYLNPTQPKTWPTCACGCEAAYLVRVEQPVVGEVSWDSDRMGDWGSKSKERYFTVCKDCKEMASWMDAIVSAWLYENR